MVHEESHEGFNLAGQFKEGMQTVRQGTMNFLLNRGQTFNKKAQERKVGSTYPIELKFRDAFKRNDDLTLSKLKEIEFHWDHISSKTGLLTQIRDIYLQLGNYTDLDIINKEWSLLNIGVYVPRVEKSLELSQSNSDTLEKIETLITNATDNNDIDRILHVLKEKGLKDLAEDTNHGSIPIEEDDWRRFSIMVKKNITSDEINIAQESIDDKKDEIIRIINLIKTRTSSNKYIEYNYVPKKLIHKDGFTETIRCFGLPNINELITNFGTIDEKLQTISALYQRNEESAYREAIDKVIKINSDLRRHLEKIKGWEEELKDNLGRWSTLFGSATNIAKHIEHDHSPQAMGIKIQRQHTFKVIQSVVKDDYERLELQEGEMRRREETLPVVRKVEVPVEFEFFGLWYKDKTNNEWEIRGGKIDRSGNVDRLGEIILFRKPKKDSSGNIEMKDGEPVYEDDKRPYVSTMTPWNPGSRETPGYIALGLDTRGKPLEIGHHGEVMLDRFENEDRDTLRQIVADGKMTWDELKNIYGIDKPKDGHIKVRTIPHNLIEKCVDYIDPLEMADYINNEWDTVRDDFRDGRYHPVAKTIFEYSLEAEKGNFYWPRGKDIEKPKRYKMHLPGIDKTLTIDERPPQENGANLPVRRPSHLNPAFDLKVLNEQNWRHWGRRYYYEWPGGTTTGSINPDQCVSTRGIAEYIIEYVTRRVLNYEDAKKILKGHHYDYGIRRFGKVFVTDPLGGESALIQDTPLGHSGGGGEGHGGHGR